MGLEYLSQNELNMGSIDKKDPRDENSIDADRLLDGNLKSEKIQLSNDGIYNITRLKKSKNHENLLMRNKNTLIEIKKSLEDIGKKINSEPDKTERQNHIKEYFSHEAKEHNLIRQTLRGEVSQSEHTTLTTLTKFFINKNIKKLAKNKKNKDFFQKLPEEAKEGFSEETREKLDTSIKKGFLQN